MAVNQLIYRMLRIPLTVNERHKRKKDIVCVSNLGILCVFMFILYLLLCVELYIPVSYTHLDVYKRQHLLLLTECKIQQENKQHDFI